MFFHPKRKDVSTVETSNPTLEDAVARFDLEMRSVALAQTVNHLSQSEIDKAEANAIFERLISSRMNVKLNDNPGPEFLTPGERQFLDKEVEKRMQRAIALAQKQAREENKERRTATNIDLVRKWMADGQFMNQAFAAMLTVGVLGSGFTFTVVFASLPEPRPGFSPDSIQKCVAASWLLFTLSVASAAWSPVAIGLARRSTNTLLSHRVVTAMAIINFCLLTGAFLASAEAVRAYQSALGITTLVLVGLTGVGVLAAGANLLL